MRHSVSISLPGKVFRQLKERCNQEDANGSEIVRRALREYFFRAEFSRLRRKVMMEAAKRGVFPSEEEIFKQVS